MFFPAGTIPFRDAADVSGDTVDPENTRGMWVRTFSSGDDRSMQLFEVKLDPSTAVESHAHREDEIMYVTAGELRFGSRVCPTGSVIVIPRMTLYGFTSGPDGGSFLNFRARQDLSYITKDDFLAERGCADS